MTNAEQDLCRRVAADPWRDYGAGSLREHPSRPASRDFILVALVLALLFAFLCTEP